MVRAARWAPDATAGSASSGEEEGLGWAELMSWDWSGGQAVLLLPHLGVGVAQLIGAGGAGARAAGPLDATGRAIERRRPAQGFTAGVGEKGTGTSREYILWAHIRPRIVELRKFCALIILCLVPSGPVNYS